ncbi:hypothetical protein [Soonwooa sp.]|uniref:hypothetical protein n=1 Tax=Soonwooa sp. TaxID=1938592 RepID=UPI00260C5825|nr:hypothetical protein [Soonwooa sp.]
MEQLDIFDSFDSENIRRRTLLPLWMKIFTWIFLVTGVAAAVILPIASIFLTKIDLEIYGFYATQLWTFDGVAILLIFLLKGIVAYGLWFEKDWAIKLAIVDAILGIVICIYAMFIQYSTPEHFEVNLRLELVLLIPYLIKSWRLNSIW